LKEIAEVSQGDIRHAVIELQLMSTTYRFQRKIATIAESSKRGSSDFQSRQPVSPPPTQVTRQVSNSLGNKKVHETGVTRFHKRRKIDDNEETNLKDRKQKVANNSSGRRKYDFLSSSSDEDNLCDTSVSSSSSTTLDNMIDLADSDDDYNDARKAKRIVAKDKPIINGKRKHKATAGKSKTNANIPEIGELWFLILFSFPLTSIL
jgi:hypothetical protein